VRVYVYPADEYGCGHFRLIWPSRVLQAAGHDIVIVPPSERQSSLQGELKNDELVGVRIPEDADVVVMQRVTHRHLVRAVSLIRDKGVAVVIDMDDDLTRIHPANPAFGAMHPTHGVKDHSWHNTTRACENATLVTVSTPALAQRYGARGHARVLFNCFPEFYLGHEHTDSDVVGWGGAVYSHPDDLQVMGTTVAQLLRAGGRFRLVGPPTYAHDALGLDDGTELETSGVVDMHEGWPRELAALGIGVAPLADTQFNAAKSWLKPLEYAALRVPCVISPRTEYVRLHRMGQGVGILAEKPRHWMARIAALRASAEMRADVAGRAFETVRDMTIEANAWRWAEVWEQAWLNQRQGASVLSRRTFGA